MIGWIDWIFSGLFYPPGRIFEGEICVKATFVRAKRFRNRTVLSPRWFLYLHMSRSLGNLVCFWYGWSLFIYSIHLLLFFWSIAAAQESWQFSADARLLLLRIRAWLVIFVAWISDATHTHTDPLVADRCHRCLSIDEQFEVFLGITCLESSFEWFCPLPVGEIGNLWQQPWKKDLFSS